MKVFKKVQSEYFNAIIEGRKRFEVRLADFDCKPGDTLVLQEQGESGGLTGREVSCEVMYQFNTKEMERFHTREEIDEHGFYVLSIRKQFAYDD